MGFRTLKSLATASALVAAAAVALMRSTASAARAVCPSAGTPPPGGTINGGLEVDGFCILTDVTVNGGITVDPVAKYGNQLWLESGRVAGGITVNGGEIEAAFNPAGELLHEPLTINGGVTLNNAADFDIEGATIRGGFSSNGGFVCPFGPGCFSAPTLCGNEIYGNVTVANVDIGQVFNGDSGEQFFVNGDCAGNVVHGSISLSNSNFINPFNGESNEIEGATVTGSVIVDHSTAEVYGNTIGGSLRCTNGSVMLPPGAGPPPDPSGNTNTVNGANTCF